MRTKILALRAQEDVYRFPIIRDDLLILNPCRNRNAKRSASLISAPILSFLAQSIQNNNIPSGNSHSVTILSNALPVILLSLHTSFGSG